MTDEEIQERTKASFKAMAKMPVKKKLGIASYVTTMMMVMTDSLTNSVNDLCDYFMRGEGRKYYRHETKMLVNNLYKALERYRWVTDDKFKEASIAYYDILDYYQDYMQPLIADMEKALYDCIARYQVDDVRTMSKVELCKCLAVLHKEQMDVSEAVLTNAAMSDKGMKLILYDNVERQFKITAIKKALSDLVEYCETASSDVQQDINLDTDAKVGECCVVIHKELNNYELFAKASKFAQDNSEERNGNEKEKQE